MLFIIYFFAQSLKKFSRERKLYCQWYYTRKYNSSPDTLLFIFYFYYWLWWERTKDEIGIRGKSISSLSSSFSSSSLNFCSFFLFHTYTFAWHQLIKLLPLISRTLETWERTMSEEGCAQNTAYMYICNIEGFWYTRTAWKPPTAKEIRFQTFQGLLDFNLINTSFVRFQGGENSIGQICFRELIVFGYSFLSFIIFFFSFIFMYNRHLYTITTAPTDKNISCESTNCR